MGCTSDYRARSNRCNVSPRIFSSAKSMPASSPRSPCSPSRTLGLRPIVSACGSWALPGECVAGNFTASESRLAISASSIDCASCSSPRPIFAVGPQPSDETGTTFASGSSPSATISQSFPEFPHCSASPGATARPVPVPAPAPTPDPSPRPVARLAAWSLRLSGLGLRRYRSTSFAAASLSSTVIS
ncbi:hypothetical protein BDW22DRAFT_256909 [Trametopsis cervina]|nr:hypothetical protein BDW22DRAFT_256909 [Trametopsis cervina]